MKFYLRMVVLVPILFIACSGCEKNKWEKEMELLDAFILENGIEAEPTASGIYYIETLKGTGPDASGGDYVTVKYKGSFIDGEEFQSGTFSFYLGYGQVIPGWDEGINYMREGGKARLIIPSNMAYGSTGRGDIPGYATLVFDVELTDIK